MADLSDPKVAQGVMAEIGDSGLRRFSGTITEEFLRKLSGAQGQRVILEMRDNHPVVGAILYAIKSLLTQVKFEIEAASDKAEHQEAAQFVSECLDDMEEPFHQFIGEALSYLEFGWSYHEIVYKRRSGMETNNPKSRSRFDDNKIGWRKLPLRSQDSLLRWELGEKGEIKGLHQQPAIGGHFYIPIERALLFRANIYKNNPEGRSLLRNAAMPYLIQRKLQEIEAIGAERDLAGLPVITCPSRYLSPQASAEERMVLNALKDIVRNIRRDDQEGIVMPGDADPKSGKPMFELKLLSSGGSRQFDTDKIIQRYDQRIAMTLLADFILLGHEKVGSFSLSSDKTDLFATSLGAILRAICEVFNRYAIPRLMALNGMPIEATPVMKHGDIEKQSLAEFGDFIQKLSGAGMPLFPDPALEAHVREVGGLPEPAPDANPEVGTGGGEKVQRAPKGEEPVAAPGKTKKPGERPKDNA